MQPKVPNSIFRSALLQHVPFTRWYGDRQEIVRNLVVLSAVVLGILLAVMLIAIVVLGINPAQIHDDYYLQLKGNIHIRLYPYIWQIWAVVILLGLVFTVILIIRFPLGRWVWTELLHHFAKHEEYHRLFKNTRLHRAVVAYWLSDALITLGSREPGQANQKTCETVFTYYRLAESLKGVTPPASSHSENYLRVFKRLADWYHVYLVLRIMGPDRAKTSWHVDLLGQMSRYHDALQHDVTEARKKMVASLPNATADTGSPAAYFAPERLRTEMAKLVKFDEKDSHASSLRADRSQADSNFRLDMPYRGLIFTRWLRWAWPVLWCIILDQRFLFGLFRKLWRWPREKDVALYVSLARWFIVVVTILIVASTPLWLMFFFIQAFTRLNDTFNLIGIVIQPEFVLPLVVVGGIAIGAVFARSAFRGRVSGSNQNERNAPDEIDLTEPESLPSQASGESTIETSLIDAVNQRCAYLNRAYLQLEQSLMTGDDRVLDDFTLDGALEIARPDNKHPIPVSMLGLMALEIALHVSAVCRTPDMAFQTLEVNDSLLFMLHAFDVSSHRDISVGQVTRSIAVLQQLTSQIQPADSDNDSLLPVHYHNIRSAILGLAKQDLTSNVDHWRQTDWSDENLISDRDFDQQMLDAMLFDQPSNASTE